MLTDNCAAPLILVVEDNDSHALLIQRAFEDVPEEYRLERVGTIQHAKVVAERHSPRLVLTDFMLPDGEGIELVVNAHRSWPVVMMTSHGNEQVAVEAIKAGALDYLVKTPESFSALPRIVRRSMREWTMIQERVTAEESLRRNEAKQRAMIQNIVDVIAIIDQEGINRFMSPNIERLFGWRPEEVVGEPRWKYIHPDDQESSQKVLTDLMGKPNAVKTAECRYRCKDASYKWTEFTAVNLLHDPDIGGILTSYHDITASKRAETEILHLNAELEQRVLDRTAQLKGANKELESFAYSVSHDLMSPLRSIDGFSLALLEEYGDKLEEGGKDCLRRVRSAAQKMARLIDDMLKLSRITRSELTFEPVNMSALAASILDELHNSSPERKVECVVTPGLIAKGDSRLLGVALGNLLGNAWKFTGGHEEARIEFGTDQVDGQVAYFVRDDGAGFDRMYAGKLFIPFQRLHNEREFPGTGIGLALVQQIINRHGGMVWAESVVGQGATFWFTLG